MALTKVDQTMVSDQVFGRRNLIINGAMRVAQRATSAAVSDGTNEGYATLDRWRHGLNNAAAATVSQSTTVPTGEVMQKNLLYLFGFVLQKQAFM